MWEPEPARTRPIPTPLLDAALADVTHQPNRIPANAEIRPDAFNSLAFGLTFNFKGHPPRRFLPFAKTPACHPTPRLDQRFPNEGVLYIPQGGNFKFKECFSPKIPLFFYLLQFKGPSTAWSLAPQILNIIIKIYILYMFGFIVKYKSEISDIIINVNLSQKFEHFIISSFSSICFKSLFSIERHIFSFPCIYWAVH